MADLRAKFYWTPKRGATSNGVACSDDREKRGVFGERLLFPEGFVGRGDMSRGGLMLRCARAGIELTHAPVGAVTRHAKRPPELPKLG